MLGRKYWAEDLLSELSAKKMFGPRCGHHFHGLTHRRRVGHFSREKVQYRFSSAVKHSPLRERYELHSFSFVRRLDLICPNIHAIYQATFSPRKDFTRRVEKSLTDSAAVGILSMGNSICSPRLLLSACVVLLRAFCV